MMAARWPPRSDPQNSHALRPRGMQRSARSAALLVRQDGPRRMDTALDADGNNLLTFEEWAMTTVDRFAKADADGNARLTPREFAATAPKPEAKKPACKC
jgi:hypothetical protein